MKLSLDEKNYLRSLKPKIKSNMKKTVAMLRRYAIKYSQDINNIQFNVYCALAEKGFVCPYINSIEKNEFNGSKLEHINITKNIQYIGQFAFEDSELSDITFEPGIKAIYLGAFARTKLRGVELPEGLEKLEPKIFQECKNLQFVYIPDSITVLPSNTFEGCPDSIKIYIHSRKDKPEQLKLKVPQSEIEWYKKHLVVKED